MPYSARQEDASGNSNLWELSVGCVSDCGWCGCSGFCVTVCQADSQTMSVARILSSFPPPPPLHYLGVTPYHNHSTKKILIQDIGYKMQLQLKSYSPLHYLVVSTPITVIAPKKSLSETQGNKNQVQLNSY